MVPPEQSGWNLEGSEACVQAVVQQGSWANRVYDERAAVVHEPQQPLNHLDLAVDFQEHSHSPQHHQLAQKEVMGPRRQPLEVPNAGL